MKLLIVEDQARTGQYLSQGLSEAGFATELATDGETGQFLALTGDHDLLILDVMLPGRDGWQILQAVRQAGLDTPVLFLTARDAVEDRVHGLELGADDYLAKPCDPRELTARLRAVLRRSHPTATTSQMELGDLVYSPARGVASIDGREMTLTLSESRILEALLRQPGEPLDKQELAQIGLGRKLTLYDRSLDMHVSNLRKKIGPHADGRPRIVALRSRGYYYCL